MNLTINGREYAVASDPLRPLLHALREDLGITGPKTGCQQGSCGTCTVLVDGEPRRSCLLPTVMAEGTAVTTIEGLGDAARLHELQAAFHHHYSTQCGFCTPGMIVAAAALLRSGSPSRAEIQHALSGHFCRCTGYVKIIDAVEAIARGETFVEADRAHQADPHEPELATKGAPA